MTLDGFCESGYQFINYTCCDLDLHAQILHVRNSHAIRQWMVDDSIISLGNHLKFIESLKSRSDRYYFAVIKFKKFVASLNISQQNATTWERGIFTSPSLFGTGQTSEIEQIFNRHLKHAGIYSLIAKVKHDNVRSMRYHEKIGYHIVSEDADFIYFKLDL